MVGSLSKTLKENKMTKKHKEIILKALASQIILTEQAIYKGESLVDAIDHDPLSHHLWEETAIHAQLATMRRRELKEYQEAYDFLGEEEETLNPAIESKVLPETMTFYVGEDLSLSINKGE
jgi:hypothetical protein